MVTVKASDADICRNWEKVQQCERRRRCSLQHCKRCDAAGNKTSWLFMKTTGREKTSRSKRLILIRAPPPHPSHHIEAAGGAVQHRQTPTMTPTATNKCIHTHTHYRYSCYRLSVWLAGCFLLINGWAVRSDGRGCGGGEGRSPALTSFLTGRSASLSLIQVNLSPDSIARCRPRWQSSTSLARITFPPQTFC